jgi:transcriptional regulator with GAF, ATPase, and Fis domain
MRRAAIALIDVPEPLASALACAAARRRLAVATLADAADFEVRAALVHVSEAPAALRSAVRTTRNTLPGAPIVLLAPTSPSTPAALAISAANGVVEFADDPAHSSETAERALRSALCAAEEAPLDLVGNSASMRALLADLRLAADAPSNVLLLGETGTGKGVAARAIHALSARRELPFVAVDCAALAPGVLESELFGHERGAFTGAESRREGRLAQAKAGTLFLDEIGELTPALQAKLLCVLEDRRFARVGGDAAQLLRARVIAGTNRDLEEEVQQGRFRRDLFFRLEVLGFRLPPLRERLEDLPVLTQHLLERAAQRLRRRAPHAAEGFVAALHHHTWPGNVRELANRLEALLVRTQSDELLPSHLGRSWPPRPAGPRLRSAPAAVARGTGHEHATRSERDDLAALLDECGGNVARVARRLGRPRSTVRYRIRRYGLDERIPRD